MHIFLGFVCPMFSFSQSNIFMCVSVTVSSFLENAGFNIYIFKRSEYFSGMEIECVYIGLDIFRYAMCVSLQRVFVCVGHCA